MGQLRVDLTRSQDRPATTAICAKATAGVDVKRTLHCGGGRHSVGGKTSFAIEVLARHLVTMQSGATTLD